MYIATNRFKVKPDCTEAFEQRWLNREVFLQSSPGFESFSFLKGAANEDHVLYVSQTYWASHQAFVDWTNSEAFRQGHRSAGQGQALTIGPPSFEGFEILQHIAGASQVPEKLEA